MRLAEFLLGAAAATVATLGLLACQDGPRGHGPAANEVHRRVPTAAPPAVSEAPRARPSASVSAVAVASLPEPCAHTDRGGELAPGQRVLVVPIRANYFPGEVRGVQPDGQVRVASWTGNTFTVERERIYPLAPAASRPSAAGSGAAVSASASAGAAAEGDLAGCYGGCRLGELWVACHLLRGGNRRVRVMDHAGNEHDLARSEVVVFDRGLQQQARQFLTESRRRDAFRIALAAAGRPTPPTGHRAHPGQIVLVASGAKYLAAEVVAVAADRCTVAWFGAVRTPIERSCAELLPFPQRGYQLGTDVGVGDFVLAKARDDHGADRLRLTAEGNLVDPAERPRQSLEWQPYRVVAVVPGGLLELADRDDRRRREMREETYRYRR